MFARNGSASRTLDALGFTPYFADQFARLDRADLVPARIAAEGRNAYHFLGCRAPVGELSGRLRHELDGRERPAVGDWVAVADGPDHATVHAVLDRRTAMVRRAAGPAGGDQVVAANVDAVFVVTSANRDLNVRRIERYLAAVWDSGAAPVVLLNKVDLVADARPLRGDIEAVALGVPIEAVSALDGRGIDALRAYATPGTTVGLVGSSGVGKSSIVNRLLGEAVQEVNAIRDDDARGRHTTTRRELVPLPGGGLLVDTPGMREFGLVEDGGGIAATFADIEELAVRCRFVDCRHETEPGCAIRAALAAGELGPDRWDSFRKLEREVAAAEARRDPVLAANERRKWKSISKSIKTQAKADPKHWR